MSLSSSVRGRENTVSLIRLTISLVSLAGKALAWCTIACSFKPSIFLRRSSSSIVETDCLCLFSTAFIDVVISVSKSSTWGDYVHHDRANVFSTIHFLA